MRDQILDDSDSQRVREDPYPGEEQRGLGGGEGMLGGLWGIHGAGKCVRECVCVLVSVCAVIHTVTPDCNPSEMDPGSLMCVVGRVALRADYC